MRNVPPPIIIGITIRKGGGQMDEVGSTPDIRFMQARLFRQFMARHHVDKGTAIRIFREHEIFPFIRDCYDSLELSSDRCALDDIVTLLRNSGVTVE